MKKLILIITSLPIFLFAQGYDPETGEIIDKNFDPLSGEEIESDTGSIEKKFDDVYNQSTIIQKNMPILNSPMYHLGTSLFTESELKRELSTFPESNILLKRYNELRRYSILGCSISISTIFLADAAPLVALVGIYGGLFVTNYVLNSAENKLRQAIWVYNRENLKKNLLLE